MVQVVLNVLLPDFHTFVSLHRGRRKREERERDVGSGGQKRGERKERREREDREERDIVLRNKFDHALYQIQQSRCILNLRLMFLG